ncbi:unnamed protein product [Cylicocyclus nassatus]|uniref:Uncharacterized protein n=1 Tax=Cylicocyclus nassatus TaxID=53992 RepID=A0AA36M9P6_CYLNA|nr:unnamed protein product [Cylicocyclus nassatus]
MKLSNSSFLNIDEYLSSEWVMEQRSKLRNGTLYFSEVIESLQPSHPLYLVYNKTQIRYDFGTTYFNFCELRKQPPRTLPSLLRVLEIKIEPQACLRMIILAGFNIKMVLYMIRSKASYALSGGSKLLSYIPYVSPIIELAASTTLMLVLCLQQDQDKTMGLLIRYSLHIFSVLFFTQGFIYSFTEAFKPQAKAANALFCFRLIVLVIFAICARSVCSTHDAYLHFKTCHTHVSISEALQEYLCISTILLFPLSQIRDFKCLTMSLAVLPSDTVPRLDLPEYFPVYMSSEFDKADFAKLRFPSKIVSCC